MKMTIDQYQEWTKEVAIYPDAGTGRDGELYYLGLGLAGEAGEVSGKISKLLRDDKLDIGGLAYEIGDCLWFIARLAESLGYSMTDIMEINHSKLTKRKDSGTLSGEGDIR